MQDASEMLFGEHIAIIAAQATAALQDCGFDGLLLPSGQPAMQFADDQPYPFKANPAFRRWVPQATPGSLLLFEPGKKPLLLFRQELDYWHLPPQVPAAPWTSHFELRVVRSDSDLEAGVRADRRWAWVGEPSDRWHELATINPSKLRTRLDYARARKTAYEIECLAEANRIAARAHLAAATAWHEGAGEFDILLEYCRATGQREEELPYSTIVACNEHSAVLHYQCFDRQPPAARRSLLVDAGAGWAGYCSDITRSHAAGDGAYAELVTAVEAAQQQLVALVVPGADYCEIHLQAHRLLASALADCGISRVRGEAAVESGVTRTFFPHGVGHLLGLQVHDVGGLLADESGAQRPRPPGHPFLRLTRRLEPGFVVTIEPGIYFIEMLLAEACADERARLINWDRVEALRSYGGVRIEDDVVAQPGGPRNLTREAFAAVA